MIWNIQANQRNSVWQMKSIAKPFCIFFVLIVLGLLPLAAIAQDDTPEQSLRTLVAGWQKMLDDVEQRLEISEVSGSGRALLRGQMEYVLEEARKAAGEARAKAVSVNDLLEALGPPPGEGEAAELQEVAKQRRQLNEQLKILEGREKQVGLIAVRAEKVLQGLVEAQHIRLWDEIMSPGPSPLLPSVWAEAIPEFANILFLYLKAPLEWWASDYAAERWYASLSVLAAALLFSGLAGWPLRLWLLRRFGRDMDIAEPSYARRLLSAAVEGVARGLLPALAAFAVLVVVVSLELVSGLFAELVIAVVTNVVLFVIVAAVTRAALAPDYPAWRVTRFTDESSRMISHGMIALVAIYAITNTFVEPAENIRISEELDAVFSIVVTTVSAAFMLALLRKRAWRWEPTEEEAGVEKKEYEPGHGTAPPGEGRFWARLRFLATVMVILAPIIGFFGYTNLTKFLLFNLIVTGLLLGGVFLLRGLVREVTALVLDQEAEKPHRLYQMLDMSEQTSRTLKFLILGGLDFLLFFAGAMFALSIWGMPPEDITDWVGRAMRGFSIGSYTISVTDLFLGIFVFGVVLVITRSLQWLLAERILPQTKMDSGMRHSIKTAVGYVGLLIAFSMAITTLGIDLSNLALVAGALSVGIGFGLQNIVSNFVSGLILLVERPIKAGDWVVIGNNEGLVKRINVRATEITTFQKASVIIPNAELVSTAVVNWTHKDIQGRIEIPIGVSYDTDEEQVRELLLQCAKDHPETLGYPPPDVLFTAFGESSLDFMLRAFIRRIRDRKKIESDLRFAVRKAFREANIEIPFPQRVLHAADTEKKGESLAEGILPASREA